LQEAAALLLAVLTSPLAHPAEQAERFDVWEYRVRGNTLLQPAAIEQATYDHLGPGKAMQDIEAARTALEEAYRAAGLPTVLVDVPEQDIGEGIVRFQVTEGRIDRLLVTGSRYFENGWIRRQVPELAAGTVPRLPKVQSELRALNARSPDRSVTPVLRPGRRPGTVEAELKVADELPLHAAAEVNNRNTADTTESRLNLTASYGNLWQREHALSLQYQVAPQNRDETEVWAASYALKPPGTDKTLVFYGVDSNSDVATVADLSVIGNGWLVGTQFLWPLPSTPALYHQVVLGAAW
jgi:hemolysin activation/secretion protein